jgi:hypothetical protein
MTSAKKARILLSLELLRTPVEQRSIIRVSHKGWNPRAALYLRRRGDVVMKKLFILYLSFGLCIPTVVFARGGMGHHSSSGGAFGSSATAPGTNSLGTALSSSDGGGKKMKGPALGTGDPAIDREDTKVDKMVRSICRGC